MTPQEFDNHQWSGKDRVTFPNHLPVLLRQNERVLAVDFEAERVRIKSRITRRPVWIYRGDFDIATK